MKKVVLLSALCLSFSTQLLAQTDSLYAQQWNRDPILKLNATTSAQRQIISSEQIRLSGYYRLSDVFQLIDGWTFSTIAGNTWMMQSNGVGNYDNQNWVLMVNGQRVEMNRFTAVDVNLLGIPVTEIERIEIVNSNGLYLNEYTQKGLIHIITRKNPDGLSYRGYYGNGISTMNQGRYQVNPDLPSYINPMGAVTSHTLGYKKGNFNITGSFNYQRYYAPDTAAISRYGRLDEDTIAHPISTFINGRMEAQYTHKKMTHQLQLFFTDADENPFNSVQKYEHQVVNAGYINQWTFNEHHQLRFSTMVTTDGRDRNLVQETHQWQWNNRLAYRYRKLLKNGNFVWQTGLGFDRMQFYITGNTENLFKPFTSVNIPLTRKSNLFGDAMLTTTGKRNAIKTSIGIYKRVTFISNWSLVAGYAEQLAFEDFARFYDYSYSSFFAPSQPYISKQLSADFYYNINIGNNMKFSYNSGIKTIYDEPSFVPYYITSSNIPAYTIPLQNFSTSYINWVNRFNIHYDIVKNLVFDFNYMRTGIVESAVADVRTVPKHKITFIFQYELPKKYILWTRGYWQSETQWLPNQIIPVDRPYFSTLKAFYTMDLGVTKKILKEHLDLNFSIRNLFNSRQQYFYAPFGAQFDTRFTIGVAANVEHLFASRPSKP